MTFCERSYNLGLKQKHCVITNFSTLDSPQAPPAPLPAAFPMGGGFRMTGPVPQFPSGASSGPMPFSMADGTRGVMMMQMSPQSIQITSMSSAGAGATAQQQPPTTSAAGSGRPQQTMPTAAGAPAGPAAVDFFNQLMQGMAAATAQMGASKGLRFASFCAFLLSNRFLS